MVPVYWLTLTTADLPADHGWLAAAEQARLAGLRVPKRRADWLLGRWTAKQAVLARLAGEGVPPALDAVEVHAAADGAPEAFLHGRPAGLSISLSHRAGVALCAVAPAGVALGCDLELVEPRSPAFVADYFTADEVDAVASAPPGEQPLLVTLLWSAKESALKALRTGLRLDTRAVSASLLAPTPPRADSWRPLAVSHQASGRVLRGWWRREHDQVVTVVAASDPEPPTRLVPARRD